MVPEAHCPSRYGNTRIIAGIAATNVNPPIRWDASQITLNVTAFLAINDKHNLVGNES